MKVSGGDTFVALPRGFTLLEMLIAMTLAALLLTVVPASFSSMLPHLERQAEAKALAATLRALRGRAIRERRELVLLLDLKRRQYQLRGGQKVTRLPEAVVLGYRPAFAATVAESAVTIRFFADGSSSGGIVELATVDAHYEIHIDWLSGKVRYREKA